VRRGLIKAALTAARQNSAMVIRPRIRAFLAALGLYLMAALFIGYFGVNAYTGNHGIKARESIEHDIANLAQELDREKAERERWERRLTLLKSDSIDPDMLDERARALLNWSDPRDVTVMNKPH
jgi:cell division protein FtsB